MVPFFSPLPDSRAKLRKVTENNVNRIRFYTTISNEAENKAKVEVKVENEGVAAGMV